MVRRLYTDQVLKRFGFEQISEWGSNLPNPKTESPADAHTHTHHTGTPSCQKSRCEGEEERREGNESERERERELHVHVGLRTQASIDTPLLNVWAGGLKFLLSFTPFPPTSFY